MAGEEALWSKYYEYAKKYQPTVIAILKPTPMGWARKYLLACTAAVFTALWAWMLRPLLAAFLPDPVKDGIKTLLAWAIGLPGLLVKISSGARIDPSVYIAYVKGSVTLFIPVLLLFALAWVMRSKEASSSIGYALAIAFGYGFLEAYSRYGPGLQALLVGPYYAAVSIWPAALLGSALAFLQTELYRQSIAYRITDTFIEFKGGLWRSQTQRISYKDIGRVVVEQSPLGRAFNYGTVIPVTMAAWGREYYTRGVGGSFSTRGLGLGIGYGRTLQEISRDPLNVLYGVENPHRVADAIEALVNACYRAPVDQLEELRKIRQLLEGRGPPSRQGGTRGSGRQGSSSPRR